ncbi:MAG: response regulator, partial [Acetobacteraceae bacterium]
VVRSALQARGCRDIVQAKGGPEALDICAGRGFDLLICDYQMAPMNGIEFLKALAASGLGGGWPVLMLSAETDPVTIAHAQALGVSAWIGKPVSAVRLIERVGTVLGLGAPTGGAHADPGLREAWERHHARLMSEIMSLTEVLASFPFRDRESASLVRTVLRLLEEINEQATTIGYELVGTLAQRGTALLRLAEQRPAAAARYHADIGRSVTTIATAMKRVVQNRIGGDGGEAGLKLLNKLDDVISPVRAMLYAGGAVGS